MRTETTPPHLVLIHGAGHGAWCWFKIRCLLETSGFKVTCLDLTSAGIDGTDPNIVLTFQHYNQPLIHFLSTLPENEKVILVGHSAGGLSITDAMYKCSEKIQVVVYLAAPMLKHGFVTEQDFKDGIPDLSEYGDISDYEYGLGPDQPPTSSKLKKEFQRELLYFMSPLEDSTLVAMLLKPEPTMPGGGAQFTGEDARRVPRVYIKTVLDRCLKNEQQDAMIQRWPPAHVFAIESDHSPFFSAPLVILVGHSAGGVCITDAMYKCSEKIQVVVYLAAIMLKHGFVTEQDFKDGMPDLSEYGDFSEHEYGLGPDLPPTSSKLKKEFQRELLYFMSPLEDSTLASMLLKPQPSMPGGGAQFTGENADRVPQVYLKTVLDRCLKNEQQDAMIQRWPPAQVFAIESDHIPFFSAPLILSGFLIQIAASF